MRIVILTRRLNLRALKHHIETSWGHLNVTPCIVPGITRARGAKPQLAGELYLLVHKPRPCLGIRIDSAGRHLG